MSTKRTWNDITEGTAHKRITESPNQKWHVITAPSGFVYVSERTMTEWGTPKWSIVTDQRFVPDYVRTEVLQHENLRLPT